MRMEPREAFAAVGDRLEIALVVLIGYGCHLYYNLVGHIASLRGFDLGPHLLTPLDRACPYMPFWVLFYQVAYFAPAIVLLLILPRIGWDVPAIRRIVVSFLLLFFVHFSLYLLFPTSARPIRIPESMLGEGALGNMVRGQYHLATVWCAWPSLHVSACWFCYHLLARYRPLVRWIYLAWFLGMFIGTFAIKIHYILDGVAGVLLAEGTYRWALVRLDTAKALRWEWHSQALRLACYAVVLTALLAGLPLAMSATGFSGPLYTIHSIQLGR